MGGGAFTHAVAAGLPVLGGEDVFATSDGLTVRGHFWKSDGGGLPVLICPGFTEFCEKFSPAAAHLHARGHSVLIIDWPGQGRSGQSGRQRSWRPYRQFRTASRRDGRADAGSRAGAWPDHHSGTFDGWPSGAAAGLALWRACCRDHRPVSHDGAASGPGLGCQAAGTASCPRRARASSCARKPAATVRG